MVEPIRLDVQQRAIDTRSEERRIRSKQGRTADDCGEWKEKDKGGQADKVTWRLEYRAGRGGPGIGAQAHTSPKKTPPILALPTGVPGTTP